MNIQKSTISEINRLHSDIEASLKTSLAKALQIGQRLHEVKENLPHGSFTAWIEENLTFTARTARNYIKLHNNRGQLTGSDSIADAYKMLKPKKETVSVLDNTGRLLKMLGLASLIPEPDQEIWLYSDNPKDPEIKKQGGFDLLVIRHSKHPGYLDPVIYHVGSELAYETYNRRGGFKLDDTGELIRMYADKFDFLSAYNAIAKA